MTETQKASATIEQLLQKHGDMIYDLCQSCLSNASLIQEAYQKILKTLRRNHSQNRFVRYEKAWVLRIICEELLKNDQSIRFEMSEAEQLNSDTTLSPKEKLQSFELYFLRLSMEQRLTLILHDKYKFEVELITTALGIPAESMKLIRIQALKSLEEWIWV